jgi:hypothetical protein
VELVRKLEVRLPEGGHDTEAIFVWRNDIYLVTKPWDGSFPKIYVIKNEGETVVPTLVGRLPAAAMVTGGDITGDGKLIALSSYRALFIFEGGGTPAEILQTKPLVCQLNAGLIEGISWSNRNLVLTNEQGDLFLVPESRWRNHQAPFQESPTLRVPYLSSPSCLEDNAPGDWESGAWLKTKVNGRVTKIGRLAWSAQGLHFGIRLPGQLQLGYLKEERPEDFDDWFVPGKIYLLMNPTGDRQVSYAPDDRCIVIGRRTIGGVAWEALHLKPATWIHSSEAMPFWVRVRERERTILITVTKQAPGLNRIQSGSQLGFNLLIVDESGQIISWAPLTLRFSWDAPSFWGLLELVD